MSSFFKSGDLQKELIELLEKIVLHNSDFSTSENLQNLLILTAMKADKTRVMDYINRLDNYDGPAIAQVALGQEFKLYEEAFLIYKKSNLNAEAMDTLLINLDSLERASEFAARCNEPGVWYKLGKAQLENGQIPDSIESYLKAEDATDFVEVIHAAEREENFDDLVRYLLMARGKVKDQMIDGELVYAYAKTDRLGDMEEFTSGTNTANLQAIGERLYDERLYKAAKIIYGSIPNNSRLASWDVQLGEFTLAVDIAKKANNPKTWKEVTIACVDAQEFRCAQIAGMHIIVHPDHLEELAAHYEKHGHFEELMSLLDSGLGNERSHMGMYTELAILYAKYKPERLMDFMKMNTAKLNMT
jgi:clathrin heavy chain